MNMIERVARILCLYDNGDLGGWEYYEYRAKAVIAAMREPTNIMLLCNRLDETRWETWISMIDVALKEEKK